MTPFAESQQQEETKSDKTALKMRGLPYSVQNEDICKFFGSFGVIDESVKIGKMGDGKLTGEAIVLFKSPEDATAALKDRNG